MQHVLPVAISGHMKEKKGLEIVSVDLSKANQSAFCGRMTKFWHKESTVDVTYSNFTKAFESIPATRLSCDSLHC